MDPSMIMANRDYFNRGHKIPELTLTLYAVSVCGGQPWGRGGITKIDPCDLDDVLFHTSPVFFGGNLICGRMKRAG